MACQTQKLKKDRQVWTQQVTKRKNTKGCLIVYGLTILKEAPNEGLDVDFLEYVLDPEDGLAFLEEMRHATVGHKGPFNPEDPIPEALKGLMN
jgi:ABC-type molybdate transport system substrate-binding protein